MKMMKLFNAPFMTSAFWPKLHSLQAVAVAVVLAGAVALPAALLQPGSAVAQESLNAQVERLQRELTALQRQVYRGEAPAAAAAGSAVTGGDLSGTQAARIELRLSQFESELRALTGQIEQFGFKVNQIDRRLDSLVTDVDLRLQSLEQRLNAGAVAGGGAGVADPAAAGAGGGTGGAATDLAAGAAPAQSGGAPDSLGVINQADLKRFQDNQAGTVEGQAQSGNLATAGQTAAVPAAALPQGSPQEQYNYAFSLLRQAQYNEAEQALRAFVEQHPEDALAGNAKYWLGETHYVRGDYQQSAVIFAEGYQQYPNNTKAPDNLLKLGMSLGALGNTADACGTFAELLKRYPNAATTVQRRTKQEQRRYSCS